MDFSIEFDTNFHMECLKRQHFADPQDKEAEIMAREFGLIRDERKPIVFLDMDGVSCDFVKGALNALGHDYESNLKHWPKDTYSVATVTGRTEEQMWSVLDALGKHFWIELEEYPWFREMYDRLSEFATVIFLSVPAWNPDSHKGKMRWIQDRFGPSFGNYILTRHKSLCAGPGRVLVDDSPHHCREFQKGKGGAVLVAQPWNQMDREGLSWCSPSVGGIVQKVKAQLKVCAPV